MNYFSKVIAIAYKDLLYEYRSRETITTMLIFSFLVVVIFNFTFDPGSTYAIEAAPGIIWVAFTFSGVLGLNRAFIYEVDKGSFHGLLLSPIDRGAIYLGKMIGNIIFMFIVEILTLPLFFILFNLDFSAILLKLFLIILLATFGFAAVGTLFSAIAVNTKAREIMLPILLFPVVVPVILSAVNATSGILNGAGWDKIAAWLKILAAFDLMFIAICFATFEYVVEE